MLVQLQRAQRVEEHDGAVCVSDPYYLRKREREKGLYIYINDGISLALEGGVVLVGVGVFYIATLSRLSPNSNTTSISNRKP